jgi:hypothetical protein
MRILTAILATLTSLTVSLGIAQAVSAPTHTGVAVIALAATLATVYRRQA